MHFSMRDWTIFSASSIFFFTHTIPLTLQAKCIKSVTNQNVEPDGNCSESEENEEDAMGIDSKLAVNLGGALAMLDKL